MTPAQKKTRDNFKKAIAYRKKTGCSLKQAFAHVKGGIVKGLDKVVKKGNKTAVIYSKKVAPKKKAAPKKKVVKQGKLFGFKLPSYKSEVKKYITKLDDCINEIARVEFDINDLKVMIKTTKSTIQKKDDLKLLNNFKKYLAELKKHKTELKKLI